MERMEKDDILRKAQERKGADELELEVERRGVALSWQIGLLFQACIGGTAFAQKKNWPGQALAWSSGASASPFTCGNFSSKGAVWTTT